MMRLPVTSHLVRQQGAALLLMMFIIGLAVTAYVVRSYDAAAMKARQEEKTMKALAKAKAALIAWSVSHPNFPGVMPFPDRLEVANPIYDGKSDCVTSGLDYKHLIGKLPVYSDSNCLNPNYDQGQELRDGAGEGLWYAVSRNLVRTGKDASTPVINPGVLNVGVALPTPYDGTSSTSPYPWMKVFDRQGNLISDRIAVVIIAPGPALREQERGDGLAPANAFLEQVTVGDQTIANYDYTKPDEDFVMGGSGDTEINDRLIFITIDELIVALEKRVVGEVRQAINFPKLYQGYNLRYFPGMVSEKINPVWPNDFSYETVLINRGYIPFRCLSNSNCNTFRSEITWNFSPSQTVSVPGLSDEIVNLFTNHVMTNGQCTIQIKGLPLPNCTETLTQDLPATVAERKVIFSLNDKMNAAMEMLDPTVGGYATRIFNVNNAKNSNKSAALEAIVTINDIYQDPTTPSSPARLNTKVNTSLVAEKLRVYPILPEWYFINRWYEYLYAAIAPAFLPGGSGVCTTDTCLHLHYVHNGVTGQRDNLPALIFTRRPPSDYQLNPEEAAEDALDFRQRLTNNTGLVAW